MQDFREELLKQPEDEAKEIALAIELFTNGSLNTFAKNTNVDTNSRIICYDILDLGKQLLPIGMLVVLDSILNRITANRSKGRNTYIFIDEIYLMKDVSKADLDINVEGVLTEKEKLIIKESIPFYLYLGGIFGVMLTLVNVITIGSIGVALTTALAVFGQLVFSSLVDHFGLFGLDKYKFNPKKLIGFMIVLIGLVIMTIA